MFIFETHICYYKKVIDYVFRDSENIALVRIAIEDS